jgi:hypothetical protein
MAMRGTCLISHCAVLIQAANRQAQAQLEGFAPAQLPLLLCALAALGQEPGAALVNAVGEALAHQELQVGPWCCTVDFAVHLQLWRTGPSCVVQAEHISKVQGEVFTT